MTGKQLRSSILQEAIVGRLVPQDPRDEPAGELLKSIRAEKARLIKEGKLPKDKNETIIFRGDGKKFYEQKGKNVTCIDDQIPFEIPDSWELAKLGQIARIRLGKTPPRSEAVFWNDGIFNWVSISDMADYGHVKTSKEKVSGVSKALMGDLSPVGTLIMSFKLTVGRTSILEISAYHNEAIISIFPYVDKSYALRNYLFYVLPLISNYGEAKNAIKGTTLNKKSLEDLSIPVPPLAEQKRIVAKIEELMPLVDEYEKAQEEFDNLNAGLKSKLRASLLQEAIAGRLVPQDPNDEPASELLKKIRKEKEKLIKEGKLPKDKNETLIFRGDDRKFYEQKGKTVTCIDDQIPFEIPANWEWCNCKNIFSNISSQPYQILRSQVQNAGDYPVVSQSANRIEGYSNASCVLTHKKPLVVFGDHTKVVKYVDFDFIVGADGVKILRPFIDEKYAYYLIMYAASQIRDRGYARHFSLISKFLFPVPPLAEQRRVVEKLEALFAVLDNLDTLPA